MIEVVEEAPAPQAPEEEDGEAPEEDGEAPEEDGEVVEIDVEQADPGEGDEEGEEEY